MNRIEQIQSLLKTYPYDSFLLHALALEKLKIGLADEAQQIFEELLNENPDYVGSYYHLAKIYEQKNEIAKALKVYEEGMSRAKKLNEIHTYNELQAAYDDLLI